jgi:hypothetical protein
MSRPSPYDAATKARFIAAAREVHKNGGQWADALAAAKKERLQREAGVLDADGWHEKGAQVGAGS